MSKETGKMTLSYAEHLAAAIIDDLKSFCDRIQVAGSIRRRRPFVNDIDIVLVLKPQSAWEFSRKLAELNQGTVRQSAKITTIRVLNESIDLYFATPETWATLLLIRTGSKENNIKLCTMAQKKNWKLHANGDGLFNDKGERVAGDTEESIYKALGVKYQTPEERV